MANAKKAATQLTTKQSGTKPGGGIFEMWKVLDAELVASTGVVDSVTEPSGLNLGFFIAEFEFFGLWINATSVSGTADVKVEILQSWDDTSTNYVTPSAGSTVVASLGETAAIYSLAPAPMPFLRIRVTGISANPADTIISAYLWMAS